MFEYFAGNLVHRAPTEVVVDCGGVGYLLLISLNTYAALPERGPVKLLAHGHYGENVRRLYGFATAEERALFRLLQGVRGVGPGLAMALLSHETPERLKELLQAGEVTRLTRVKGVGRKTAERLVVELKDRLPQVAASVGAGDLEAVLSRALVTLGLTPSEAERRARETLRESGKEDRLEVLLRSALRASSRATSG